RRGAPARRAGEKDVAFVGRVVDAGGKPTAGADVALLGQPKSNGPYSSWLSEKVLAGGRADADGKFRLAVAHAALADHQAVYVIAGKSGHGPAPARAR